MIQFKSNSSHFNSSSLSPQFLPHNLHRKQKFIQNFRSILNVSSHWGTGLYSCYKKSFLPNFTKMKSILSNFFILLNFQNFAKYSLGLNCLRKLYSLFYANWCFLFLFLFNFFSFSRLFNSMSTIKKLSHIEHILGNITV